MIQVNTTYLEHNDLKSPIIKGKHETKDAIVGGKMEKYKNYLRINNKNEKRDLQKILHPDKLNFEASLANDLMSQFNNSTCSKTNTFPCIVKFDKNVDGFMQGYNAHFKLNFGKGTAEESLEFFVKPYVAHISKDSLSSEYLVEAVSDFFDNILLYY